MRAADFLSLRWADDGRPLIEPPRFSPVIADPSFLFPEETSDGRWRLFAHSAWGIHAYESEDGEAWLDAGIIAWNAMRAFVRRVDGRYLLFSEKYLPFHVPMTILPVRPRWKSRIEVRESRDLLRWGAPKTMVLPELPWEKAGALGESVGNPCLLEAGPEAARRWRLYFSASLVHLPDCGFEEPRFIGMAEADSPTGPFTQRSEPVIDPGSGSAPEGGLGAGSLKVLRLEDGWVALQNKITLDGSGRSRSALWILVSDDGIHWRAAREEPLLAPSTGWRSSHVYACDVRFRDRDGRWYLYYNARDGWYKTEGRERIGRLTAG
jgi:hypothetical protein